MSRSDLRYLARHPLHWAAHYWFHLVTATMLWSIAAFLVEPAFNQTIASEIWPIFLGAAGALAIASTLNPFDPALQALTGATIAAAGTLRVITWAQVLFVGPIDVAAPVAWTLLAHWTLAVGVGVLWPDISERAGTRAAVAVGRDVTAGTR